MKKTGNTAKTLKTAKTAESGSEKPKEFEKANGAAGQGSGTRAAGERSELRLVPPPEDESSFEDEREAASEGATWTVDDPELAEVFERMMRKVCPPYLDDCVEDLVQEGLLRLMKRGDGRGGERRRFNSTYLWTTATNLKREEQRRRYRHEQRQPTLRQVDDEAREWELPDPSPDQDPDRAVLGGELRRAVRACLAKLVRSRQRVVTLRLIGYTVCEVARFFGWSPKRAENLAVRGLADLRRCLKNQGVVT